MATVMRFAQAFRTPDLRKKLVFTFGIIVVFRIGIGSQALFSGVSLLIMVGVGLDTIKQVESQLRQHHYEGCLHRPGTPATPATPAGKVTGTPEARAALTVS